MPANQFLRDLRKRLLAQHPALRRVPLPLRAPVHSRGAVSHANKYIYIRVPKAANSTISRTLAWLTYPEDRATIEANDEGNGSKKLFSKYPWRWWSDDASAGYFKFIFVRDPFSRVLSAYLDKINPGFDRPSYMYVGKAANKRPSEMSFGDFIGYLEAEGLNANIHWAPQVDICPFPVDQIDLVGKVENLDADLEQVVRKVFGATEFQTQQRVSGRTNSADRVADYYDPKLAIRVAELYRRDFDAFGYDAERLT